MAPHFAVGKTVPGLVRLSNGTGVPALPDADPHASPHGIALRFHLPDGLNLDIVSISSDGFPVATAAKAASAMPTPQRPHRTADGRTAFTYREGPGKVSLARPSGRRQASDQRLICGVAKGMKTGRAKHDQPDQECGESGQGTESPAAPAAGPFCRHRTVSRPCAVHPTGGVRRDVRPACSQANVALQLWGRFQANVGLPLSSIPAGAVGFFRPWGAQ